MVLCNDRSVFKNKKTIATIKTNNTRTKIQVGEFSYPTKMNENQKLP